MNCLTKILIFLIFSPLFASHKPDKGKEKVTSNFDEKTFNQFEKDIKRQISASDNGETFVQRYQKLVEHAVALNCIEKIIDMNCKLPSDVYPEIIFTLLLMSENQLPRLQQGKILANLYHDYRKNVIDQQKGNREKNDLLNYFALIPSLHNDRVYGCNEEIFRTAVESSRIPLTVFDFLYQHNPNHPCFLNFFYFIPVSFKNENQTDTFLEKLSMILPNNHNPDMILRFKFLLRVWNRKSWVKKPKVHTNGSPCIKKNCTEVHEYKKTPSVERIACTQNFFHKAVALIELKEKI
jgi:hypothetical protein